MSLYELELEEDFDIQNTLFSGQIFSFHKISHDEFIGPFNGNSLYLKKENSKLYYKFYKNIDSELIEFFDLKTNYKALFSNWNSSQKFFVFNYDGLRLLKYDFYESLFSFICSSNNNIKRITKMVNFLFSKGMLIEKYKDVKIYNFPDFKQISFMLEDLKNAKFGYRAEYICKAAEFMLNNVFKKSDYNSDCKFLQNICGVGRKVADCVCLMGLGYKNIVPIDTHVFKNVKSQFLIEGKLNKKNYDEIQAKMKELFGDYAGIAQLYIFRKSFGSIK